MYRARPGQPGDGGDRGGGRAEFRPLPQKRRTKFVADAGATSAEHDRHHAGGAETGATDAAATTTAVYWPGLCRAGILGMMAGSAAADGGFWF